MSENNTESPRNRRRAVRTVGPPPAEADATTSGAVTVAVPKSGAVNTPSGADTAVDKPAADETKDDETKDTATTPVDAAASNATAVDSGAVAHGAASDGALAEDSAATPGAVAPGETDTDDQVAEHKAGIGVGKIAVYAAAVIVVLALVAGATLSVFAVRSVDERDARRAEYVQTARQAIVNLTTIRADSAKDDIDRILSVATGEFKTEFDGRVNPFTDIVKQVNIVSTGEVVDAAVEGDDENSARVLVAAKQTLTNAGEPQEQTRLYRFRVTIIKTDDGPKASKVEFVA
ncbi:hypothetical protein [Nocardia callitridis]|uniref:Mce-associated membrane protein n=1 Tax=Nocardia callitridis TaxID=648753 RepID=A0ABP9JVV1_9NOCA